MPLPSRKNQKRDECASREASLRTHTKLLLERNKQECSTPKEKGTERAAGISIKDNKAPGKAWSIVGGQQLNKIMKLGGEDLIQFMESSCLRDYLPLPSLE